MIEPIGTITEADILAQVLAPENGDLSMELAQMILRLHFSQPALDRMNDLADKNRRDQLTVAEKADLQQYLRVGQFLNLLQAKARVSLTKMVSAN